MKDILLKRNDLRNKSIQLRTMRFEPNISQEQVDRVILDQNKVYDKWKFYDKFIKAREEAKNEKKELN